jgi:hypothetical protein
VFLPIPLIVSDLVIIIISHSSEFVYRFIVHLGMIPFSHDNSSRFMETPWWCSTRLAIEGGEVRHGRRAHPGNAQLCGRFARGLAFRVAWRAMVKRWCLDGKISEGGKRLIIDLSYIHESHEIRWCKILSYMRYTGDSIKSTCVYIFVGFEWWAVWWAMGLILHQSLIDWAYHPSCHNWIITN